jgi:hypothetical protein
MINQLLRALLISTPSDYEDNEFEDDFDDDVEESESGN